MYSREENFCHSEFLKKRACLRARRRRVGRAPRGVLLGQIVVSGRLLRLQTHQRGSLATQQAPRLHRSCLPQRRAAGWSVAEAPRLPTELLYPQGQPTAATWPRARVRRPPPACTRGRRARRSTARRSRSTNTRCPSPPAFIGAPAIGASAMQSRSSWRWRRWRTLAQPMTGGATSPSRSRSLDTSV